MKNRRAIIVNLVVICFVLLVPLWLVADWTEFSPTVKAVVWTAFAVMLILATISSGVAYAVFRRDKAPKSDVQFSPVVPVVFLVAAGCCLLLPPSNPLMQDAPAIDGSVERVFTEDGSWKLQLSTVNGTHTYRVNSSFSDRVRDLKAGTHALVQLDGGYIASLATDDGVLIAWADYQVEKRKLPHQAAGVLIMFGIFYTWLFPRKRQTSMPDDK